jgi:hypothetical protein
MFTFLQYSEEKRSDWDRFVQGSKNGTFLFLRGYMDYHNDRFSDHSLLVFDERNRLIAVLPANLKDQTLWSHGGLTYGGFVTDSRMTASTMLKIFEQLIAFLKTAGVMEMRYKAIPHIFHKLPAEEDEYSLFKFGAKLYRRDLSTAITPRPEIRYDERVRCSLRKAANKGLQVFEADDFSLFWPILEENLMSSHGLKPTHSLAEISLLKQRFPNHIRLFCTGPVLDNPVAGTVLYDCGRVVHTQYIASTSAGKAMGAVPYLLSAITNSFVIDAGRILNFGISTEKDGQYLNEGLSGFKESLGGSSVLHNFYSLAI